MLINFILLIESELESEAKLAADVERVIVTCENKSESLREAVLAANVESVIVARKNESELFREARL